MTGKKLEEGALRALPPRSLRVKEDPNKKCIHMLCLSYQGVHLSIKYFSFGSTLSRVMLTKRIGENVFPFITLKPLDTQKISLIIFLEIHILIIKSTVIK